jgi:drug/metabolite transporter (DMT)-like permease
MGGLLGGNALLALAAAAVWGGGDFSGGMGVKAAGGSVRAALRVVLLSHASSFTVLVAIALLRGDPFPHGAPLRWGIGAGLAGGVSLTCFYIALARGAMGASAALSGLLAAAIPTALTMAIDGSPGVRRLAGFAVAGAAIWLIAAGPTGEAAETGSGTVWLALVAGLGFGIYFISLKLAGPAGVVWPMATARMGSLTTCSLMLFAIGLQPRDGTGPLVRMGRRAVLWSLSTALLDTSGNLLFVAATRAGRLDVAAVLASLYPASTIVLAAVTLGERPTRRQGLGMAVACGAVVLIAG